MMAIVTGGQIRCKCLYYSTSLRLNLDVRGHPSFLGGCVVWGLGGLHRCIMDFDRGASGYVFALGRTVKAPGDVKYGRIYSRFHTAQRHVVLRSDIEALLMKECARFDKCIRRVDAKRSSVIDLMLMQ